MTKKIVAIGMFLLLAINFTPMGISEGREVFISIKFGKLSITEYGEYATIHIKNASAYLLEPGKPIIPYKVVTFSFPLGTRIRNIKCHIDGLKEMHIEKKIKISPSVYAGGKIIEVNEEVVYNSTEAYPNRWFSYEAGGAIKDGKRQSIYSFHIYPVRYIPALNKIEYAPKIDISFDIVYGKTPKIMQEDYDLLIITPSQYSSLLNPLVEHKNNMGIPTIMVTLDDIPLQGRDKQEDIKYFIKDAIENWGIRYVMLVGDKYTFPVRYTHVCYSYGGQIIDDELFVSDLYYADIYDENGNFSSWDTNNNDVFGEFNWGDHRLKDDVDLYPDVYLGRIACTNGEEVTRVVNKIIKYEEMKSYGEEWFSNVVVVGGDTVPDDEGEVDEGEYIGENIVNLMEGNGFSGIKIWASNGKVTYASNINTAIEDGAGFVSFSGHGSPTSWATHPHKKQSWLPIGGYKNSNVEGLQNTEKFPIVVLDACSNSKFDEVTNCIAWTFVSHEGGAIATFGNAALGWGYGGTYTIHGLTGRIEYGVFKMYANGAKTFGEIWGKNLIDYLVNVGARNALDVKTVEEWEPFGDPSLQIASPSLPPNKPQVSGPTSGKRNEKYAFQAVATDPDGDDIYYLFDWGDGSNSGWLGPFKSGEPINATHSWSKRGTYEVKVKVKDEYGAQSEWSDPISIKIRLSIVMLLPFNLFDFIKYVFQIFLYGLP